MELCINGSTSLNIIVRYLSTNQQHWINSFLLVYSIKYHQRIPVILNQIRNNRRDNNLYIAFFKALKVKPSRQGYALFIIRVPYNIIFVNQNGTITITKQPVNRKSHSTPKTTKVGSGLYTTW